MHDHPATGIEALARRYSDCGDHRLRAGDLGLFGSFTHPTDIHPGGEFRFDYGPVGPFELGSDA